MAENRAAFSLRRRRSLGFSKCRWLRTSFKVPSRSIFFFNRRSARSTDSPFLSLISVNSTHFLSGTEHGQDRPTRSARLVVKGGRIGTPRRGVKPGGRNRTNRNFDSHSYSYSYSYSANTSKSKSKMDAGRSRSTEGIDLSSRKRYRAFEPAGTSRTRKGRIRADSPLAVTLSGLAERVCYCWQTTTKKRVVAESGGENVAVLPAAVNVLTTAQLLTGAVSSSLPRS
jgi:hypothetical protein